MVCVVQNREGEVYCLTSEILVGPSFMRGRWFYYWILQGTGAVFHVARWEARLKAGYQCIDEGRGLVGAIINLY